MKLAAALPEAPALAAANKRIGNILKKAERADAHVSEPLLQEDAEKALYAAKVDLTLTATVTALGADAISVVVTLDDVQLGSLLGMPGHPAAILGVRGTRLVLRVEAP